MTQCGRDVFIVEAVRTAIGKGKKTGAHHNVHPAELLAVTLREVVRRAGIEKKQVEDVVAGCVSPTGKQGFCVGRLATLKAGFPITVPGVQINRFCGSGQQAIHFASQAIAAGDMECAIGCGVEMMGVVRMGTTDAEIMMDQKFQADFPHKLMHQGNSCELIGEKYGISREQCDRFALESHRRCAAATKAGHFRSQIVQVGDLKDDEGIRWPSTYEKVASLRSVFKKDGIVTAGNASQVSDGAAAVLVCSGDFARKNGLRKRARIVARVVVGSDPKLMLDGVIPATQKVLEKAGLSIREIDCFEINEAFAAVVLAWKKTLNPDPKLVNPNGGAVAHGHPLGATGAVLMTKLVNELERTGGRYGLQTMCIGLGMATATIIERVDARSNL